MSTDSTRTQIILAHIFCVAQQFTSVTVYVLGKKIMATVDVYHLVFLRLMFVIPIVFLAAALFTRRLAAFRMPLKMVGFVIISGIFGIFLAQSVAFVGLSKSTATNMSIISAPCTPLFTALFSVMRGTDKMNIPKGFGFLSSIIGALLLLQVWNFEFKGTTLGNVLIVGSAVLNAFNSLLQKHILNDGYHPLVVQAYVCSVGILSYVIGYSGLGLFEGASWEIPGNIWIYISIVGVVATALPWCVSIIALKHTSPMTTSVYVVLQPLIAGFIGVVLMGEVLTWIQMIGSALVLLGLVLVNAQPIIQKIFLRNKEFALLPIEEKEEIELKVISEKGDETSVASKPSEEVNYELSTKGETNAFVIDDEERKDGADYKLDERREGADYKPIEGFYSPDFVRLRHEHETAEGEKISATLHNSRHLSLFVDGADCTLVKKKPTDFFSASCKEKDILDPPTPTLRPVV